MRCRQEGKADIVGLIAATAVACILGLLYWNRGQAFDPVAWRDYALVWQGVRQGMADRLINRGTLRGKTRAEVVELLGEPLETGSPRWDMKYWLGPERSYFSVDSEWLVLRLDRAGRVVEYRIVRD
jgi:hypothetical protein